MKQRGFTLVELLAVIIIIGIMGILIVPTVNKSIKDFKKDSYDNQIETIETAARHWGTDNPYSLPTEDGGVMTITLGTLKAGGYVDADIKNPITDKSFRNDLLITITRKKKNFVYKVDTESGGTDTDVEINERAPIIVLCGSSRMEVNLGGVYQEPQCEGTSYYGARAYDYKKNPLPDTVISKTGSVNTSVANKYTITYIVLHNNMTTSATRTVVVKDLEAPVITVNGTTTNQKITVARGASYTIPMGSATDNSGKTFTNIRPEGTVNTSQPGTYRLVYTAKDDAGNVGKLEIVITVQ